MNTRLSAPVHSFGVKASISPRISIKSIQHPEMAQRILPLPTISSPQLLNPSTNLFSHKLKARISCSKSSISDAALASELATKVAKINTHLLQTEEALKKSRELLFGEFCEYLALKEDEVKMKWGEMHEEEKWVLVKKFVAEWGTHFHPLSARSAKEMVEAYLQEGNSSAKSPPSVLFPPLKRVMGFS